MAPRAPGGMTRWLGPALAVLALVLAAVAVVAWLTAPGGDGSLVLVEVSGDVIVDGPERDPATAGAGMVVGVDEQLRTGQGSTAVLSAGEDTEIRVEPSSSLVVRGVADDVLSVELEDGRVRADVRGGRRALRVQSGDRAVQTVDGAVAVAVEDGVFAVEVQRGTASTEGLGPDRELSAGGRVVGLPDGSSALGEIPDALLVDVAWPTERRTRAEVTTVRGRTAPGARVTLTGGVRPVTVRADAEGAFEVELSLREGAHPVLVEAVDPFGRRVTEDATLERDTTPPIIRGGGGREAP